MVAFTSNRCDVCVNARWLPVYVNDDNKQLAVMSLAFFLNTRNDAVIWRGPKKDSVYFCCAI